MCAEEILVGIDFLRTHKCVLNFDTRTVYFKKGPSKMVFGYPDKVCRITVAETITLSPNMVADIPCQVHEAGGLDELEGVLEPSENVTERYAAGALRTVVTIKDGGVPVRVFNPLNKPSQDLPIQVPPRRVPFHKREGIRRQVDEMLEAEIIEPFESSWSSPVVLVEKPDGTQRFCVDYRALN